MKKILSALIVLSFAVNPLFSQEENQEKKEMKPALLVIDVQKEYMPMMSKEDQEMAIEMMNWSIWVFRKFDLPVIRVYHTSPEWGFTEENPTFEFHDSLKVTSDDPKIVKTYGSSFTKTDLDKLLKEKDVNTVFLCGLSAVGCVLATYMD